jgi:SAM-dependent methyltransferase
MALAQHVHTDVRFQQQVDNAREYLLPFLDAVHPVGPGMQILEIGSGEGGVLRACTERGAFCVGVDLSPTRIEEARQYMAPEVEKGNALFLVQNVYDPAFQAQWSGAFDWILLKDTIEHIPDQEKFIPWLKQFLRPGGRVFFGFPPWRMPFGGHQQICRSKVLGMLPWFHLLPRPAYAALLRTFGESPQIVQDLLEIKDTGISINRFENIIRKNGFVIESHTFYFINPIYRYKFGIRPRVQAKWLSGLPFIRDFFTTAVWYVIRM